jgi:hypothetical protein
MKALKINHHKRWTDADKEVLRTLDPAEAATKLRRTLASIYRARKDFGICRAPIELSVAPEAPYKDDVEQAAGSVWRKKYSDISRKYAKALTENSVVEQLVEEIRDLAPRSYSPLPPVRNFRKPAKSTPQSAMLLFSDTHVGKVVLPSQTLGFGEYNFQVYLARLKYLEESILSILKNHTTMQIDELVVAMLGDMLDGALAHGSEAGQRNTAFTQFYNAGHATAQFLRVIAAHVPALRVKTVVGNHCVDTATEIFTRRGWLRYDEVNAGDECLGMEADGKTVRWQPVKQVVIEPQVDRMVSIRNRTFSFRGTEHHRFYYWVPGHPMLNEARWSEIDRSLPIIIPTSGSCPGSGEGVPDSLIELCAAVLTDGSIQADQARVIVYQNPRTEGWVREAFEKSGLAFTVRRRTRKSPTHICGRSWKGGEFSEEVSYALSAPASREFLVRTGLKKGSLPPWVWNLTHTQFSRFLQGLLNGDGTDKHDVSPCLFGKSKEWLGELQGLCALHNVSASVSEYRPNNGNPSPQYRLNLVRGLRGVTVGGSAKINTESTPTGGKVWCVRTETENFLCRRDGKSYFTGNTRWQNQKKMPTENRYSNLDMFYYSLVEALTKDIKNIQWDLNMQPFALFKVQGFTFHAAHGDHLRGGDKTMGIPNHAIGREISTKTQLFAKHNMQAPHYYVCGHLHRGIQLPHAQGTVMINGGFPGLDNYALAENFNPVDATQRFFFMHPRFGKTAEYELSLKFAEVTDKPPYILPGNFPIE